MSTDSGVSCLAPAWLLSSDPRVAGDNRRSLRILLGGRTGEGAYTLIVAADAAGCNPHRGPCRRGSGGAAVVLQQAAQARRADDVLDRDRGGSGGSGPLSGRLPCPGGIEDGTAQRQSHSF